jgi:hypothetical protein
MRDVLVITTDRSHRVVDMQFGHCVTIGAWVSVSNALPVQVRGAAVRIRASAAPFVARPDRSQQVARNARIEGIGSS